MLCEKIKCVIWNWKYKAEMCPQKSPKISSFVKSFWKTSRGDDLKVALFSAALSPVWLWTPLKPAGFRVPMGQVSALPFQHYESSVSCSHTPLSLFISPSLADNLVWIWLTKCTRFKTQMRTNGLTWTNKDVLKCVNDEIHRRDSKQESRYLEHGAAAFPRHCSKWKYLDVP